MPHREPHLNTGTHDLSPARRWLARGAIAAMLAVAVTACSKTGTETNPAGSVSAVASYRGPAPANGDIQSFKLNVWDNLSGNNRCGACHSSTASSPQMPFFADQADVNAAYTVALPLMDRLSPEDSRLVIKVGSGSTGHNCWEASTGACEEIMTRWIAAWAGADGGTAGREIELTAPASLRLPGASLSFPDDPALFGSTVYPLLTGQGMANESCARCHSEAAATPQAPFFASPNLAAAYEAAKDRMDLNNPELSRFVLRTGQEFHNCWSADCTSDAADLETAIRALANGASSDAPADNLVTSMAQRLDEGIVASGGSRHESHLIALWEFKTGTGNVAYDTSGISPAINLTLTGDVSWVGGWGIQIGNGKAQGSTTASKKLRDLIVASGEYSIEAWVVPANVTQEEARIVSYSAGPDARNVTLGQTKYQYDFFSRSRDSDRNGEPALSTLDADRVLQASLQHVVATFDPVNGRRIYVNGELKASGGVTDARLADWDDTYAFVIGNEVSNDGLWQGTVRMVAVHNRALTEAQIQQNFAVGVGEKFFLLFNVGELIDPSLFGAPKQHYIMLEVARYDSYSYLFNKPTFVTLEPGYVPANIPVAGMRIGVNGKEAVAGQTYQRLNTTLTTDRQLLSPYGTVIALERGPLADEFFLTFERFGSQSNVVVEAIPPREATPPPAAASDIGVRTFGEINATLSEITGIPRTHTDVAATFTKYEQQLPAVENIEAFVSSNQMAVAQLALSYCDALVDSTADRARFFPGFNFSLVAGSAFDATGRAQIIDPLLNAAANADRNLATQPGTTTLADVLGSTATQDLDPGLSGDDFDSLMSRMLSCVSAGTCPNNATRTAEVVKGTCAAVLGSAVMLIQ